jgi:precorrin-6A/cobalt-precorrin-6A reductase
MKVLILGGTTEGRRLAEALVDRPGFDVVSSLAGRVRDPRHPPGALRIGGFGGPAGLAAWLAAERVDAIVDATHPFAAGITANAVSAATTAGVPLLVLRRPPWIAVAGDRWIRVSSLDAAASAAAGFGRVFLTTGRQSLAAFASCAAPWFLVRSVDPPAPPMPPHLEVLLDRGPFTFDGELALLRRCAIDVVVTKNSGGDAASPKLAAARQLGLPVVMVDRPPAPSGMQTVEAALSWLARAVEATASGKEWPQLRVG